MIAYAHFRRGGAEGREPIAAPGEVMSIAAKYTPAQQYWGKITSRPQRTREELELVAYRLGCSVSSAKRAIDLGLLR